MQIYNMHSIWTYQIRLIERREIQSKWRTVNFGTTALDVKAPLVHKDHFIHVHAALGIGFRLVAIIATTMSRVGSNQEALNNMMCHSSLAFTKIAKNVGVCGFVLTLFYYPKQIRLTNHKATGTSHVFFRSSWGPRLSKTAAKVWHAEISPPQFWEILEFYTTIIRSSHESFIIHQTESLAGFGALTPTEASTSLQPSVVRAVPPWGCKDGTLGWYCFTCL